MLYAFLPQKYTKNTKRRVHFSVRNALRSKKQAKRLRYVFVHFCGGKSVRYVVAENILRV